MTLNSKNLTENSIDLKEVISTYSKNWKWFVLSSLIALLLALTYLRYATPQYAATAKIQILEDEGGGSGLDIFQELSVFGAPKNKVSDEIQLMSSRSIFMEVVKELKLNTKIRLLGNVKNTEIFKTPPINLNFMAEDSTINNADFKFYITLSSSTTFGYSEEEDKP